MRAPFPWISDSRWARVALGLMLCIVFECHASAQTLSGTSTLEITHPRPVLQALEDLTAKYGYVITYEEPKIVYSDDMKDITQQRKAKGTVIPRRVFAPKGGSLQVTLPGTTQISEQALDDLLHRLLQSWTDSNQGGAHFRVEEDGTVFHVVPTEVRDQNGNWQVVKPILDTPISLASAPRTDLDTLKAIASAAGAKTGVKVFSLVNGGVVFGGSLDARQYVIGADDEPAASVLMRAFKAFGKKRTWYLLYDPTMRAYVLNIDDIQATTPSSQAPKAPAAPPAHASRLPARCPTCSAVRRGPTSTGAEMPGIVHSAENSASPSVEGYAFRAYAGGKEHI